MAMLGGGNTGITRSAPKATAPRQTSLIQRAGATPSSARSSGVLKAPSPVVRPQTGGTTLVSRAKTAGRAPIQQSTRTSAPAPAPSTSYGRSGTGTVSSFAASPGGFDGGGASGGGDFASAQSFAAPIEPPGPKPWEQLSGSEQTDYLAGDGTFAAQQAALQRQLEDEEAAADRESNDFGQEILRTLRNMGFMGANFKADDAKDQYAVEGGGFDAENRLGAYGQAFGNQENDFASRGMLDSSGYDRGFGDLRNSFDQQRGDVMDSFTTFMNNAMGRRKEARNTNVSDVGRAKADAIARRAATLGLI